MQVITTERENGTRRVAHKLSQESKVEQSHRDECNINSIIGRYRKTGLLEENRSKGSYGDFTGAADFQACQNRIIAAQNSFLSLPADIRETFDNDPAQLLAFINDPENASEAIEMGLLPRASVVEQTPPDEPAEGSPETVVEDTEPPT